MKELLEQRERLAAVAKGKIEKSVLPRMEELARHFDNAKVEVLHTDAEHHCVCVFAHTPRFPATVKLGIALLPGGADHLTARYDLNILPVLMEYTRNSEGVFSLENDDSLVIWVEDRILDFVDTYLRLETHPLYQKDNTPSLILSVEYISRQHPLQALSSSTAEHSISARSTVKKLFSRDTTEFAGGSRRGALMSGQHCTLEKTPSSSTRHCISPVKHSLSGLGDITLKVGYVLLREKDSLLQIRPMAFVKFPTADKNKALGTGEFDEGCSEEISKWFGNWNPSAEAGYTVQGKNAHALRNYMVYNADMGYQVGDNFRPILLIKGATARADGQAVCWKSGEAEISGNQPHRYRGIPSQGDDNQ